MNKKPAMLFTGKKVVVVGFGLEGSSATKFLLQEKAQVTVWAETKLGEEFADLQREFEKQGVTFCIGQFTDFDVFDWIVRSPGVHPEKLYKKGVSKEKITTVTNIFLSRVSCSVIGVTGTKGKGTTSSLIYEILKKDGRDVYLGGNIGLPPLDFLSQLTSTSVVVLELSSFQLIDCVYSPQIAVILMTVPEHQDWHNSVDEYVEAKLQLTRYQNANDTAIISLDYPLNRTMIPKISAKIMSVSTLPHEHTGVFVTTRGTIVAKIQNKIISIFSTKKLALVGKHNWENAIAAVGCALVLGVKRVSIRSVLSSFTGLPYRLELIREVKGVKYYNDSFATTPETAIAAIHSFDAPKVLIVGGSTKAADFTELGKAITQSNSIRAIIGIDPEWQRIKAAIGKFSRSIWVVEGCKSMAEIINKAQEVSQAGDIVLLSPGCASFGMFKNYKDRGDQFKEAVLAL